MDQKIVVSERAVIARLNRVLAKSGQKLRTARGERAFNQMGRHYIVGMSFNRIEATHVPVEDWARDLGALKPYERMEG